MEITKLTTKLTSRANSRTCFELLWFAYGIPNFLRDLKSFIIKDL